VLEEAPQHLRGPPAAASGVNERADRGARPRIAVEGSDAGGERANVCLERAAVRQHEHALCELLEHQLHQRVCVSPALCDLVLRDVGAARPLDRQRVVAVIDQLVCMAANTAARGCSHSS